jgi:hypothetical protein
MESTQELDNEINLLLDWNMDQKPWKKKPFEGLYGYDFKLYD